MGSKNGCDCENKTYSKTYVLKYSEIVLPVTLNPLKHIGTTTNCTTIGTFTLPINTNIPSVSCIFGKVAQSSRNNVNFACWDRLTLIIGAAARNGCSELTWQ